MSKKVKFSIEVEMEERWVDDFCSMLKLMEYNGNIGHSGTIAFYADGDGDFHPKFEISIPFNKKEGCWNGEYFKKYARFLDSPEILFDAG